MRRQFFVFLIRWALNSFGLWLAVRLFGTVSGATTGELGIEMFLLAGLIFSVINAIVRPIAVILALPAILLTLGLFIIVVNGIMVYISLWLLPEIRMTLLDSILTGMILSLINYIVSGAFETKFGAYKQERV